MITMSSFKYAGLIISIIISLISCTHNKNYPTAFQPELAKAEAMMSVSYTHLTLPTKA